MKIEEVENNILKDMIEEYYKNKGTVNELLKQYGVDENTRFIQAAKLFLDEPCEVCGGKVQYILESRAYCKSLEELKLECLECGHDTSVKCKCKNCVEFRKAEQEKKKNEKNALLEKTFYAEPKSIKELSIKELLFLGIVKENEKNYNLGRLFRKNYLEKIHIYIEDSAKFLENLLKNKVISINIHESDIDNFVIDNNGRVNCYIYKLYYNLNIKEDIFEINIRDEVFSRFSSNEIKDFWIELSIEECLAYLDIRTKALKLGGIESIIRKEIAIFIEEILKNYSTSEVMSIIYKSVNYASNFKVECEVEDIKVHKAVYRNMKNHIEKQYQVNSYSRSYELEQSTLSNYFCKNILELDSDEVFKLSISSSEL